MDVHTRAALAVCFSLSVCVMCISQRRIRAISAVHRKRRGGEQEGAVESVYVKKTNKRSTQNPQRGVVRARHAHRGV